MATLCINADVLKMAGANADATYTAEAYTNVYILMAEGQICKDTGYDWVTNYASVSDIGKELLRLATASKAAQMALGANPNNFLSPNDLVNQINLLETFYRAAIKDLEKDGQKRDFVLTGA